MQIRGKKKKKKRHSDAAPTCDQPRWAASDSGAAPSQPRPCFLDYSKSTWVYLMKSKFDTSILIQNFFHVVTTQFNASIKFLRSDNGPKFAMSSFFTSKGVFHQLSCVETPQQNSIVEMKHQHLLNVARAFRFQVNLPLKFWGYCILTATYLINRIRSPILHNLTPFEKLLGHPPSYSYLKIFGCLCYASTLTRNRTKFDTRAKPCIILGYPNGIKGYFLNGWIQCKLKLMLPKLIILGN